MVDGASVALVRQQVRVQATTFKLPDAVAGSLVNIVSELGHNQLAHARRGSIAIGAVERDGVAGLEIIAADMGDGLVTPSEAINAQTGAASTNHSTKRPSLGIGLAAVFELADELDFDVRVGEGTCIWARKFARPVTPRRQVGIYGRPYPGEEISGDHACFVRDDSSLLLGVVDGLGHGPFARIPAELAIATQRAHPLSSLEQIVDSCHIALDGTRGAVMSTARLDEAYSALTTACVGNVSVRLYGPQLSHRFAESSFVLGARGQKIRPALGARTLAKRDVVVMFTDGLLSRFELESELDLLREHPIVIAQRLVERFARGSDDVCVLVAV